MADRKDDIGVRIVADYDKALADMQRFTGIVEKSFDALPKVVQNVATSVDKLTERIDKMGRADGVDQVKRKLNQANDEAKRLSSTFDRLLSTGKAIGAAMTAWQAGKAVLTPTVTDTMDYGMRLAHATNVTAPGASVAEKTRVMTLINTQLEAARRGAGGKREDILTGFESLMARNSVGDMAATLSVMPGIAKTAIAGNASVEDLARASSGLIKSLGVAPKDNEKALAQLFYAGQDGGFELNNMAHYLPSQSAAARNAGLSGLSAVAKLAALNELAIDASGTPDQAGVNVGDFLNSMNSAHLANNLKRFSVDKKNKTLVFNDSKRKGKDYLDLGHQLAANAAHGIDAIDTMIQITGMAVKGDPKYAEAVKKRDAARQRLDEAKKRGDSTGQVAAQQDLAAITDSVVQILEGRGIGKLFHNQQEMRGAIGVLTNPQAYHDKVINYSTRGTIANRDNALSFLNAQPGFQAQMYGQDKAAAVYTGMEGFDRWLGKMAHGLSDLYQQHPALAAALEGGKVAVNTMAAAAGSAALVMTLLTRNALTASAALGGVGGLPGTRTITGGPHGAGMSMMGKILNVTGAGAAGWEIGGLLNEYLYNPAAQLATGDKNATVGTALFDLFHRGEQAKSITPTSLKSRNFAEDSAVRKQRLGFDGNTDSMKRALSEGTKPAPIEARLKIDLAIDQNGNAYVKEKTMSGNMRLDTGPMMTY